MEAKNIGMQVEKPKRECDDDNCPFHGNLSCRGRVFIGTIISVKMSKTAIVEWERKQFLSKYERYEKRRSRVKAHNPACIDARNGAIVKIMECRPLSKTKNFVIIEVLGKEKGFEERMEAEEEAKVKKETKIEEQTNESEKKVE